MSESIHEFSTISHFTPETFGQPGQRTFRINVVSGSSDAKLWLEKEQLAELCLTIIQTDQSTKESLPKSGKDPDTIIPSELTYLDFKILKLAFGYNIESGLFIIDAHQSHNETPTVRMRVPRKIALRFANEGLEIVTAGRALCELCEKPIDPEGHHCERKNGHSKKTADFL